MNDPSLLFSRRMINTSHIRFEHSRTQKYRHQQHRRASEDQQLEQISILLELLQGQPGINFAKEREGWDSFRNSR
jgi:hypothetical protein